MLQLSSYLILDTEGEYTSKTPMPTLHIVWPEFAVYLKKKSFVYIRMGHRWAIHDCTRNCLLAPPP